MSAPTRQLRILAFAALACLLPVLPGQEIELIPSGPLSYDQETGELVATEGAEILYENWILSADTIRYNRETGEATATGDVVFSREELRLVADYLYYKPREQFARIRDFRAGNGHFYVDGSLLEGNPNEFRFEEVNFYPGEPGTFLFEARAGELMLVDQNVIRGKRLFFKVGPVPFLLIPNITQPLDAETNLFRPKLDYSGHIGASIGAEILAPVTSGLRLGGNIALSSQRGILVGPAARYTFGEEDYTSEGSFISGYIEDQGELGTDVLGNPIDEERYFAEWQHQQFWNDRASLSAYVRYWSDSEVTRDFYEESFDQMQDPDSYLDANYNGENWQLSLFARAALNDFQSLTERLPELRFNYLPSRIIGGLSHSGFLSAAKLESSSGHSPLTNGATRLDGFYGMEYHKSLSDGVSLGLKAGARGVRYDDATAIVGFPLIDAATQTYDFANPMTRDFDGEAVFGDLGADLNFKAYSTVEFKNDTWNIDGIRHILEPRISYRYTPDLQSSSAPHFTAYGHANGNIVSYRIRDDRLGFDPRAFGNYLLPIDIENRRDVDNLREDHKIRFELRNRIQTRHEDGGSRELARVNLATDYYLKGSSFAEEDFSLLHLDFELTPADWLDLGFFARFDPENGFDAKEFNSQIAIQDPGYWRIGFGSHFLEGVSPASLMAGQGAIGFPPGIRPSDPWGYATSDFFAYYSDPDRVLRPANLRLEQYYAFLEYSLSENLKLYATTRYDDESGVFYEQRIGLMQRALDRYGLKYEIRFYDGDRREDDFGVSLGIDVFDEL